MVDLGCAPGGWLQVVSERIKLNKGHGALVGIDLPETDPIGGAQILVGDITEPEMPDSVFTAIDGKADAVLSDMAAATTGHRPTDHLRTMALLEIALDFAVQILTPGGTFLAKAFRGGAEKPLMDLLHKHFDKVRHIKPPASRQESVETYLLATGFKALDAKQDKSQTKHKKLVNFQHLYYKAVPTGVFLCNVYLLQERQWQPVINSPNMTVENVQSRIRDALTLMMYCTPAHSEILPANTDIWDN